MKYHHGAFSCTYDPLDQFVNLEGSFRPASEHDTEPVLKFLLEVRDKVNGSLGISFRKLRFINARGVNLFGRFVAAVRDEGRLRLKVVASQVISWEEKLLPTLKGIWDGIEYEVFDKGFYRSQGIIEDADFIPLLRNQTRILWPQEKKILGLHGLKEGMRVADVCCGCGDVPLLLAREFKPGHVVGVDHSTVSIAHARKLQESFDIRNAEFREGDATALMLPDNSFDFVLCRLSLQIFSKPDLILAELVRITRPGGRIYVLCEDYDLIVGFPHEKEIREVYDKAARYGADMGMDLVSGKKLYTWLEDAKLTDIRTDHIVVDTNNTPREDFAQVIQSWKEFSAITIGDSLGLDEAEQKALLHGYDAHLRTIRSSKGYTTWTMVACSGMKAH